CARNPWLLSSESVPQATATGGNAAWKFPLRLWVEPENVPVAEAPPITVAGPVPRLGIPTEAWKSRAPAVPRASAERLKAPTVRPPTSTRPKTPAQPRKFDTVESRFSRQLLSEIRGTNVSPYPLTLRSSVTGPEWRTALPLMSAVAIPFEIRSAA